MAHPLQTPPAVLKLVRKKKVLCMDKKLYEILQRVLNNTPPTRDECIYLLGFHESTPEATFTRERCKTISCAIKTETPVCCSARSVLSYPPVRRIANSAPLANHTRAFKEKITLDDETIRQKVHDFTKDGDLYCLWLMTMDKYDLDYYINALKIARRIAPPQTLLYTNVGDTDYETFVKIRNAGADGAYHVIRLGEGTYTTISPKRRQETMDNAKRAGLALQDCLEPIGTEHTPDELVDHIFKTIEKGVDTAGVMKRTPVPRDLLHR